MTVARRAPAPEPLLRVGLHEHRARAGHVDAPRAPVVALREQRGGAADGRWACIVVGELALARAVVGAVVVEEDVARAVAVIESAREVGGDARVDEVVEEVGCEGGDVARCDRAQEARQG